jgi:hypothetical protein
MLTDESFLRLIEFMDKQWPDCVVHHSWDNAVDPDLAAFFLTLKDAKGNIFQGLSHMTLRRDGEIVMELKIFFHEPLKK